MTEAQFRDLRTLIKELDKFKKYLSKDGFT